MAPAEEGTAFLKTSADLDKIFSIKCYRQVNNDNTVPLGGLLLQIAPQKFRHTLARCKVLVCRHLDQTLTLWYGPHLLGRYSREGKLLSSPQARKVA